MALYPVEESDRGRLDQRLVVWGRFRRRYPGSYCRAAPGYYNEFVTLTGAFHSGPLSAIRYVGLCGLVLVYLLSIAAAVYSYKCVKECQGTPLFPVAIFFAIQLIWGPIHYTFVFGGYDAYLPDLLFNESTCLRLLHTYA